MVQNYLMMSYYTTKIDGVVPILTKGTVLGLNYEVIFLNSLPTPDGRDYIKCRYTNLIKCS